MIHDHRPYYAKQAYLWLERAYARHFVIPQFERVGAGSFMMKPWNISVHGAHIIAGDNIHIVTATDRKVSLSTWTFEDQQGHIAMGDNCLVCPGVRIDSASMVTIKDNCMMAAGAYITDADWHDVYDRTRAIGTTRAVTLEENVWVGDGATICKGVTIGKNSVIGAGSIVVHDIPENVIAAGNPAKVVKPLDPDKALVTRAALFADPRKLESDMDQIDRYVLKKNGYLNWLRTLVAPKNGD